MLKAYNNLSKISTKQSEETWEHFLEGLYCARYQLFSCLIVEKLGKAGSGGEARYVGKLGGVRAVVCYQFL